MKKKSFCRVICDLFLKIWTRERNILLNLNITGNFIPLVILLQAVEENKLV